MGKTLIKILILVLVIILIGVLINTTINNFQNMSKIKEVKLQINEVTKELEDDVYPLTKKIGLVSHWSFDGDSLEDLKGDNDGINHDAIYTPEGKFGGAFEFDGETSFIELPKDSEDFNLKKGAISFWIYPDSSMETDFSGIIHYKKTTTSDFIIFRYYKNSKWKNNKQSLNILSEINNSVTLNVNTPENSIQLDHWSYVIVTQDGNGINVWINGEKQLLSGTNSKDWFADHYPAIHDFSVGEKGGWSDKGKDAYFKGKLDDINIYNRKLIFGEIKNLATKE